MAKTICIQTNRKCQTSIYGNSIGRLIEVHTTPCDINNQSITKRCSCGLINHQETGICKCYNAVYRTRYGTLSTECSYSFQVEIEGRLKSLSEQLQSFVDPFDLDVFLPHLLHNLERQLARSTVSFTTL